MCTKFQVDWTSTSSNTTLTKNINLKRDEWQKRRTDERTYRLENIMPLYYNRWGIKKTPTFPSFEELPVNSRPLIVSTELYISYKIKTNNSKTYCVCVVTCLFVVDFMYTSRSLYLFFYFTINSPSTLQAEK